MKLARRALQGLLVVCAVVFLLPVLLGITLLITAVLMEA